MERTTSASGPLYGFRLANVGATFGRRRFSEVLYTVNPEFFLVGDSQVLFFDIATRSRDTTKPSERMITCGRKIAC
jgi:hypothetical protein